MIFLKFPESSVREIHRDCASRLSRNRGAKVRDHERDGRHPEFSGQRVDVKNSSCQFDVPRERRSEESCACCIADLSDIRKNVPGEPGVDYPAYSTLPQTGFTCEGRSRGKYTQRRTSHTERPALVACTSERSLRRHINTVCLGHVGKRNLWRTNTPYIIRASSYTSR